MRYVELAGERISKVGLGTWQFGSAEWGYGSEYADGAAPAIVAQALASGVNLFDTAEIYAFGQSEEILGRALRGHRESAFIASKIFPVLPLSPLVQRSARRSAARLAVASIDLYQLHWPSPHVPLAATMAGFRSLLATGTIRHVGISNYGLARWKRAESALGGIVLSNQVPYSLVNRRAEKDLIPHAEAKGRLVLAYSPLGQGFLGGSYRAGARPGGVRRGNRAFRHGGDPAAQALLDTLTEVAAHHGATPAQVSLAWVTRSPAVVAIPGARTVEQMERNAAAADLNLDPEEIDRLSRASAQFQP